MSRSGCSDIGRKSFSKVLYQSYRKLEENDYANKKGNVCVSMCVLNLTYIFPVMHWNLTRLQTCVSWNGAERKRNSFRRFVFIFKKTLL